MCKEKLTLCQDDLFVVVSHDRTPDGKYMNMFVNSLEAQMPLLIHLKDMARDLSWWVRVGGCKGWLVGIGYRPLGRYAASKLRGFLNSNREKRSAGIQVSMPIFHARALAGKPILVELTGRAAVRNTQGQKREGND